KVEGLVRGNPGGGSSPLGRICAGNRGGLLKPSRVTVHLPLRQSPRELRARLDAELAKHVVKVVLDGACADEQPGCDLSVGLPLRREARDLRLLRGELVERVHGSFAGPLTGRQQLAFGAAGERLGAHARELLERSAQLASGVEAAAFATQPLHVQKVSPCELEPHTGSG